MDRAEYAAAAAAANARPPETETPEGQKFPIGTRVRVKDPLPPMKSHFSYQGEVVTILYSYAQKFGWMGGKDDVNTYAVDGSHGMVAWYDDDDLEELPPTPTLKTKTIITHLVDYSDLERFATEVYGLKDYSFCVVEECSNDSSHEFQVDGRIESYDECDVERIKVGGEVPMYRNYLVLNSLCRDGYIEPGNYTVRVCW